MTHTTSIYRLCSRHMVRLTLASHFYNDARGRSCELVYFRCPTEGCSYKRSYKYQTKPYHKRGGSYGESA